LMNLETAYKRVGKQDLDEDPRSKLQSAHGRGKQVNPLLDEEDMIDEREMRRAQNRLKRRDYEELLEEEDKVDDLFDNPLERYDDVIEEAPMSQEMERLRY
jgi:hypothetical protein